MARRDHARTPSPHAPKTPDAPRGRPARKKTAAAKPGAAAPGPTVAAPELPPSLDDPRPFYTRSAGKRAQRDDIVRMVNKLGLHLVCGRSACGRAKTCTDRDEGKLPLCFWQHRGTLRMVVLAAGARLGLKPCFPKDLDPDAPRPPPVPRGAPTLFGALQKAGAPIDRLRKPLDAPSDPFTYEDDPVALAMYDRIAGFRAPLRPGGGGEAAEEDFEAEIDRAVARRGLPPGWRGR